MRLQPEHVTVGHKGIDRGRSVEVVNSCFAYRYILGVLDHDHTHGVWMQTGVRRITFE